MRGEPCEVNKKIKSRHSSNIREVAKSWSDVLLTLDLLSWFLLSLWPSSLALILFAQKRLLSLGQPRLLGLSISEWAIGGADDGIKSLEPYEWTHFLQRETQQQQNETPTSFLIQPLSLVVLSSHRYSCHFICSFLFHEETVCLSSCLQTTIPYLTWYWHLILDSQKAKLHLI